MSETRAQLDQKLARLELRAREFSPKRYARDHMPEYLIDRVIGGLLTLIGIRMAVKRFRTHRNRRAEVKAALASYGRW